MQRITSARSNSLLKRQYSVSRDNGKSCGKTTQNREKNADGIARISRLTSGRARMIGIALPLFKGGNILSACLLFKVLYFAAMYLALLRHSDMDMCYVALRHWPVDGGPLFLSHFATWDAAHYLHLSEAGYIRGDDSCAFYPLWPLLIKISSFFTGVNPLYAALILANVFSLAAFCLFHRIMRASYGDSIANLGIALLCVYPGSVFYQHAYSEPLFMLLLMVCFNALEKRNYWLVWLSCLLLPMTRALGLFIIFPLIFHLSNLRRPRFSDFRPAITNSYDKTMTNSKISTRSTELNPAYAYIAIMAPLSGWIIYLLLMNRWTLNPFEGFRAQNAWEVHSIWNLIDASKFLKGFFAVQTWHEFSGSFLDRCVFILYLHCAIILWRIDKKLIVWSFILGLIPAMSGTFTSYTRFASVNFTMFIALASYLAKPKHGSQKIICIIIFITLHIVLAWRHVNFRWAG